ncbi:AAA domain-containing protein [Vibrio harveyi]|uniref:AAA domain-containing protein n=1 Tax=Vibrio harveyi TaxID=669 RepID=UPI0030FAAE27
MKLHIISAEGLHASEHDAVLTLERSLPDHWTGYAGFLMADVNGNTMEIDVLIFADDRVFLVELKNLAGTIEMDERTWYQTTPKGDTIKHPSPIDTKRNHADRIKTLFERDLEKRWGSFYIIQPIVVLCGPAEIKRSTPTDDAIVTYLDDFKEIGDKSAFARLIPKIKASSYFHFNPKSRPSNPSIIRIFDEWRRGGKAIQKRFRSEAGYVVPLIKDDIEFEGPKNNRGETIYNEYIGEHSRDTDDQAIVRIWNFNNLHDVDTTMAIRSFLGLREDRALRYMRKTDHQLGKDYLLEAKHDLHEDILPVDMAEVYALPPKVTRLDALMEKTNMDADERLSLLRSVLTPFASMHAIGVSHRDLSAARLWWEPTRGAIMVSGLTSAKFPQQSHASLADLRQQMNTTKMQMPEDVYGVPDVLGQSLDVFQLGVLAYRIIFGKPLKRIKESYPEWEEPEEDLFEGKLHTWIQTAIKIEAKDRFENAGQMLEQLAKAVNLKNLESNEDKDRVLEELQTFATTTMPMMVYPMTGTPVQDLMRQRMTYSSKTAEDKECVVSVFTTAFPNKDNHGKSQRLLHFFKRCKLVSTNVVPVPKLLDFGHSIGGTHVVQEYADGINLAELLKQEDKSFEQRYDIADSLMRAIHKLHDLELSHGDLKPDNILVQDANGKPCILLLDMFDIDVDGLAPSNSEYSPNVDISASARDRYATYCIVGEIFEGCEHDGASKVREEIKNALGENRQTVPGDLELLRRTLTSANEPEAGTTEAIAVYGRSFSSDEGLVLEMDSGVYHLRATLKQDLLRVFILGFTHKLSAHFILKDGQLRLRKTHYDPLSGLDMTTDSRAVKRKGQGQQPITQPLILHKQQEGGGAKDNDNFVDFITSLPVVKQLLNTQDVEDPIFEVPNGSLPIRQIWRKLVEVERATLPTVTVTKNIDDEDSTAVTIQVAENIDVFDFAPDDIINVTTDNHETYLGKLDIQNSGNGILVLQSKVGSNYFRFKAITEGVKLTLSHAGNDTSWDRRYDALTRVLAGDAVMSDLTERFISGPQGEQPPALPQPTEEQLSRYGLDSSKAKAFKYVLANPLSVLMGPPGTGKTYLTSTLLHYLITEADVRRILVVSQSHVAADEVAVRARELLQNMESKNGTVLAPSIVRLGDRERISSEMVEVHTSALQDQARTKFHRELEVRMLALAKRLMLPKQFVLDAASLYRTCGLELFKYKSARDDFNEAKLAVDEAPQDTRRTKKLNQTQRRFEHLHRALEGRLKAYTDESAEVLNHEDPLMAALYVIAERSQVDSPQRVKRMADVLKITHHWFQRLTTDERGYASFAARTRQLVVGTLVGIGSEAYELHKNSFDIVIIDEAARATFSELAIAMQSAKRVMLVGDHKQLAPGYDTDHITEVCRSLGLSKEDVVRTDFERAFKLNDGHMLSTQYRMAKPIGNIISHCFYKNKLGTGRDNAPEWMASLPAPWNKTVSWIDTSGDNFIEDDISSSGKPGVSNEAEADLLYSLLQNLFSDPEAVKQLKAWNDKDSTPVIGIITGYRKQVELLEQRLEVSSWAAGMRNMFKIDTIDSYQGSENRIIMLSLVRHNTENKIGFMNDEARVNVALSRAKERLMIIGAGAMWNQADNNTPLSRVYDYIARQIESNNSDYLIIQPDDIRRETEIEEYANA